MDSPDTLKFNGTDFPFEAGDTILDVARRNGIYIPTLCHLEDTTNTGACRVCVVEVKGARSLVASCAMPASKGMEVHTESPKVVDARKFVVSLLMISGNHNCAARGISDGDWTDFQLGAQEYDGGGDLCDAYGACTLQELAYRYQVQGTVAALRLRGLDSPYPLEDVNPFILRDFSRCILCGRCVKACTELQVNNAISLGYRGAEAKIVARGDRSLAESDCVFCGHCVQVCPVGALVEKDNRHSARPWELTRTRSTCGHCGTGCTVDLFTRDGVLVRTAGAEDGEVNRGALCVRGRYGNDFVAHKDRLTTPMVLGDAGLEPSDWDRTLDFVSGELKAIIDQHGPDSVAVYAGNSISNEDAFALQRFFRDVVGTPNIDNTSSEDQWPALTGLTDSLGAPGAGHALADVNNAQVFLVAGADITNSHPVIASHIKRRVRSGDAKLIIVDSELPEIVDFGIVHLKPRKGFVASVFSALAHLLTKNGAVEEAEQLHEHVAQHTPESVVQTAGVSASSLEQAADLLAGGTCAMFFGSGITTGLKGRANVSALANLWLLCGAIHGQSHGLFPLRTQANSQGVCDMGCLPDVGPGYASLETPGLSINDTMKAIGQGTIKALFVLGANPAHTLPGPAVKRALQKLDLLVVHDLFLNETGAMAHVALPAPAFVETDGTFTNFERRTAPFAKAVAGPAAVLDTWTLCQRLSVLLGTPLGYDALSDVHNEILSAVSGYAGDGLVEVSCQPKYTDVSAIPSAPITSGGPPPLPGAPRQPEMLCRYSEVGTWMKKRNSTS